MEKYDIDDEFDPSYMRHAIELAKKGLGWTNPNPMVGATVAVAVAVSQALNN